MNIPELPKENYAGKCPWRDSKIMDSTYENFDPGDTAAYCDMDDKRSDEGTLSCPNCSKPIEILWDEETVTTYDVQISAKRTATDERYIKHMQESGQNDKACR